MESVHYYVANPIYIVRETAVRRHREPVRPCSARAEMSLIEPSPRRPGRALGRANSGTAW